MKTKTSTVNASPQFSLTRNASRCLIAMGSALLAILLAGAPAPVAATTITFESLAQSGNGVAFISSPYIEAGFQFSTTAPNGFQFWQTGNPNYPGSTALSDANGGGITTLTQLGSGEFSILSIDLMAVFANSAAQTLTFIGTLPNNSTVTQTFNVPASGNTITENLFLFTDPGFLDVKSVTFATQNFPYFQFDNVTVNPLNGVPDSASTWMLLLLGLTATFGLEFFVRRLT